MAMDKTATATQEKTEMPSQAPTSAAPAARMKTSAVDSKAFKETVVAINRVAKVVKGGKRFSFAALVVIGDGAGSVGAGLGKAREVQASIQKGHAQALKSLVRFPLVKGTIPHEILAKYRSGKVWMRPACVGTGVIAGRGVRAILEAGGVKDVLSKSLGSSNVFNVVGATLECLKRLRTAEEIAKLRGKS